MPAADKPPLKHFLRSVCFPELTEKSKYFSLLQLRELLVHRDVPAASATLLQYLHEAVAEGVIHRAGRGWFSSLATPFELNREPVRDLASTLENRFPLLEFSCWSTAQIAGYGHHLLGRFVAFAHTERDSMESVAGALRVAGWSAFLNPTQQEVTKSFRVTEKTVVVRPAVSRAPVDGKFASVEKLLVDLHVESTALQLMDAGEYQRIVANLAGSARISVGTLAQYAERRSQRVEDVLPGIIK